jgi:hypothetical protein
MGVLSDLNINSSFFNFSTSVIDELNMSILDQLPEITITGSTRYIPPGPIPCFLKGTKILTDKGEKLIETLEKDDILINNKGEKIQLLDIYNFKTSKNIDTHPCLIKKGEIINGNNCNSDLYISQQHGILMDNYFIPVKKLVTPQQITDDKDYYTYYHLITENFFTDVVISNGIPTETYHKGIKNSMNRNLFSYLKNTVAQNGKRILLEKEEFNNLIVKFSKLEKIKEIVIQKNGNRIIRK